MRFIGRLDSRFMGYYRVTLMNPTVLIGVFIAP